MAPWAAWAQTLPGWLWGQVQGSPPPLWDSSPSLSPKRLPLPLLGYRGLTLCPSRRVPMHPPPRAEGGAEGAGAHGPRCVLSGHASALSTRADHRGYGSACPADGASQGGTREQGPPGLPAAGTSGSVVGSRSKTGQEKSSVSLSLHSCPECTIFLLYFWGLLCALPASGSESGLCVCSVQLAASRGRLPISKNCGCFLGRKLE